MRVGQDQFGLFEDADEIFPALEVDSGFAADGGIDLREKGGGDLHEADSAHVDAGEESGDVSDDSAAQGDEHGVAVGLELDQLLGEIFDGREIFAALAIGHFDHVNPGRSAAKESSSGWPQWRRIGSEVTTTKWRALGRVSRMCDPAERSMPCSINTS